MDEKNDGAYEAIPLQCHACAARDGESRRAAQARSNESMSSESFDGLYFGVIRREVT